MFLSPPRRIIPAGLVQHDMISKHLDNPIPTDTVPGVASPTVQTGDLITWQYWLDIVTGNARSNCNYRQ